MIHSPGFEISTHIILHSARRLILSADQKIQPLNFHINDIKLFSQFFKEDISVLFPILLTLFFRTTTTAQINIYNEPLSFFACPLQKNITFAQNDLPSTTFSQNQL